jgi:conjugal transfer pilus assembly protein TraW
MRIGLILSAFLGFAAAVPPAAAKDYGQVGTVFPLLEPDMLRVIELKLKALQANGQLDAMNQRLRTRTEARVRRPEPVAGIELATRARTWLFDPSIVIDHDIRDHKGNLISAAGTRVNPLDYVVVTTPLVFIDGDDDGQLAWAIKRFDAKARLIMVKGAPLEAMTRHQRRFYFDQAGRLTAKFGITHVPAMVEPAGRAMRVTETPVKGKSS